ncbi:hypothetical protein [Clostridium butyricum]|uniref:hypothetical protein n=1 Tax=Clostridium butyricum TaxID=1492 RepID=UPI0013D0FF3D|nr:hypothetical protein [Clostridium butyricum]MCQ2017483.1 hypothetical protein [Clostridium butyricum]MCQ2023043.1 hypothetical protein [Clostridium butyricum]NFB71945.1 hypothetical protein [Clostridium butyricum]NFB91923.1 hypothetical protein [Clostridium butyricum]UTY53312.1 hypothetical protein HNS01_09515 [Clostridium butyricum]
MAIFDLKANIDLKQNLNLYTTCKQLDSLNLILSVFDNSVQTNLINYNVRLKAMKADKVPLVQEHIGISISSNVINIETDEQLTTTSGKTLIELQFIDKGTGKKKATFNLVLIVVSTTLEVDRGISKATYTLLEELENKLDQASDFFENIEDAIVANNNLKKTISDSKSAESNLETAITNANNKKNEVDEAITNATNKIAEVEQSILNADNSKTELDASKTIADTTKIDLDNANVQAEKNIEELNKIGDATDLAAKVQTNTENISKNNKSIEEVNSHLNEIANPNLLINSYFINPVNQRGKNSYNVNGGFTIDRWRLFYETKGFMTINDGYISISNDVSENTYLEYKYDIDMKFLEGKKVTFTIVYKSSATYRLNSFIASASEPVNIYLPPTDDWTVKTLTYDLSSWKYSIGKPESSIILQAYDGSSFTNGTLDVKYIKLELGDKSTPFVPRLYGEELALCQRYYTVLNYAMNTGGKIASQYVNELNKVLFDVDLPTPMRILPTMTAVNTDSSGMRFVNSINLIQTMENTIEMLSSNPSNDVNNLLLSMRLSIPTTTATAGWVDCFEIKLDSEIY